MAASNTFAENNVQPGDLEQLAQAAASLSYSDESLGITNRPLSHMPRMRLQLQGHQTLPQSVAAQPHGVMLQTKNVSTTRTLSFLPQSQNLQLQTQNVMPQVQSLLSQPQELLPHTHSLVLQPHNAHFQSSGLMASNMNGCMPGSELHESRSLANTIYTSSSMPNSPKYKYVSGLSDSVSNGAICSSSTTVVSARSLLPNPLCTTSSTLSDIPHRSHDNHVTCVHQNVPDAVENGDLFVLGLQTFGEDGNIVNNCPTPLNHSVILRDVSIPREQNMNFVMLSDTGMKPSLQTPHNSTLLYSDRPVLVQPHSSQPVLLQSNNSALQPFSFQLTAVTSTECVNQHDMQVFSALPKPAPIELHPVSSNSDASSTRLCYTITNDSKQQSSIENQTSLSPYLSVPTSVYPSTVVNVYPSATQVRETSTNTNSFNNMGVYPSGAATLSVNISQSPVQEYNSFPHKSIDPRQTPEIVPCTIVHEHDRNVSSINASPAVLIEQGTVMDTSIDQYQEIIVLGKPLDSFNGSTVVSSNHHGNHVLSVSQVESSPTVQYADCSPPTILYQEDFPQTIDARTQTSPAGLDHREPQAGCSSKKPEIKSTSSLNSNSGAHTKENRVQTLLPDSRTNVDRLAKVALMGDPDPMTVEGKKSYSCRTCGEVFNRMYHYRRHQISHTGEKRGSLSMKNKIDIINRSQAGERHIDLAMEYNVGRSTLTSIIKNAQKFLAIEKEGKFGSDRKRLRGAKREDVEEALYLWYRQSLEMNVVISGPKLCQKAKDFAAKLGYKEFKATHGWLDRFKQRKKIALHRNKTVRDTISILSTSEERDTPKDFASVVLPGLLGEYESNNVFYAEEFGLFFSVLPDECEGFKNARCARGAHSAQRLTVLLCTNMTCTEKFPLLVAGRYKKPEPPDILSKMPIQYYFNGKAWITVEHFNTWLNEIDRWFVGHSRKVLLLTPTSPIHPKDVCLNAVKVVTSPQIFKGPVKLGISKALKQHYRRSILQLMIKNFAAHSKCTHNLHGRQLTNLSLMQALRLLASAWQSIPLTTVTSSFLRAGFSKFGPWAVNAVSDAGLSTDNLELLYCLKESGLKVKSSLTFNDYVTFDDGVQAYSMMNDDDIIATVTRKDTDSSDSESEINCPEIIPSKLNCKSHFEYHDQFGTSAMKITSGKMHLVPHSKTVIHDSLRALRDHVGEKALLCPELSGVFDRLEAVIINSLQDLPKVAGVAVAAATATSAL